MSKYTNLPGKALLKSWENKKAKVFSNTSSCYFSGGANILTRFPNNQPALLHTAPLTLLPHRDTCETQSAECLTLPLLRSAYDLRIMGSRPSLGCSLSRVSAWDSLPSCSPPPPYSFPLK